MIINNQKEQTNLKTSVTYKGNGTQKQFDFPFDYLRKAFVKVSVNDAIVDGYTIDNRSVIFNIAPASNDVIVIYRETSTDRLVSWADASVLKAADMTISQVQQLHILEEGKDWSIANSMVLNGDNEWEGRNHKIVNVVDPTTPQGVVTKHYMETVQGGFVQQNEQIKNEATKQAQLATQKAKEADTSAKAAKASEGVASTKATEATEQAQLAKWWAQGHMPENNPANQSAKEWAKASEIRANIATEKAELATQKATESLASANKAKENADAAKTSAATAKSSEAKAKASETAAKASETAAKSSETKAKSSETAAKASETNASNSANTATTKASEASASAAAAKSSETNAGTAATKATTEANRAKTEADRAKNAADSVGNPVVDVEQSGSSIKVTKGDGSSNSIRLPSIDTSKYANLLTDNTFNGTNRFDGAIINNGALFIRDINQGNMPILTITKDSVGINLYRSTEIHEQLKLKKSVNEYISMTQLDSVATDVVELKVQNSSFISISPNLIWGINDDNVVRVCILLITGAGAPTIRWNCIPFCDAPTKEANKSTIVSFLAVGSDYYLVSFAQEVPPYDS